VVLEDGKFNIVWDSITNIFYIISFVLIPLVIASALRLHDKIWFIELIIDSWLFADIIMNFFTSYTTDIRPVTKLKTIMIHYLSTYFIIDVISTIPGLVTIEKIKHLYYFKLLRYLQIRKFFNQLRFVLEKLGKVLSFMNKKTVENVLKIVRALFGL